VKTLSGDFVLTVRFQRGEGRYFGASDTPSGPLCSNCHQRGHKRANCKTVVCMACGMVDDHYTQHCPKSIVCSNCGEKGHYKNQCTEKQRRVYCQTCSSTRHFSDRCTSIWRSYLTIKDEGRKMGLPTNIYCYNCAEKGHYGDECPLERTSRVPNMDGSAFSGHNLPQQLRDSYFSMQKKRKRDYDYDYDDDKSSNYGYQRGGGGSSSGSKSEKKKNGIFGRIKDTFKRNKQSDDYNDYDEGPSKKKKKQSKKDIRKAKSMPSLSQPVHSGILPKPKTPAATTRPPLDYPRNPNYNNHNKGYPQGGYNNDYGNNYGDNYSRSGYLDNYSQGYGNNNYNNGNGNGGGYSRSGYLEPSRSGSLYKGSGGKYGKNNNRGRY